MTSNCPVCMIRRGKRKCPLNVVICAACCGEIRSVDKCPATCPYLVRGRQFMVARDMARVKSESDEKISHFQKNLDRLGDLLTSLERDIAGVVKRDPYYHDEIILSSLKKAKEYFMGEKKTTDGEMSLNREGLVERTIRDTVASNKLRNAMVSMLDVDAVLTWEIYRIQKLISEGAVDSFIDLLRKEYATEKDQQRSPLII